MFKEQTNGCFELTTLQLFLLLCLPVSSVTLTPPYKDWGLVKISLDSSMRSVFKTK